MKSKKTLFAGIIILIMGIVLKKTTDLTALSIAFMVAGVLLKTLYIVSKAQSGEYKPGMELFFVFMGLSLFFTGIYFRNEGINPLGSILFFTGIGLKIVFIILFIKKVKRQRILESSS
jgi:FtsH-binding integral membrane protein